MPVLDEAIMGMEKGKVTREREITDILDDEYIPTTNVHLEIENHLESG
jgi:hypothetical protein